MKRRSLIILQGLGFVSLLTGTSSVFSDQDDPHQLSMWQEGDSGERLMLRGRVVSPEGRPVEGATIQVRHADGDAQYTAQYQGSLLSGERGTFAMKTVVPGQYTSAKHIHIQVSHPDYQTLNTEILFKGDPNISFGDADALEVLLEQIHQGEETVSVGGVEIVLNAK